MIQLKGVLAGILSVFALLAQEQIQAQNNVPKAVLNYNAEKSGESKIDYNSSFLIFDHNLSDADKKMTVQRVMNTDPSFKEIQFLDANGTKDMMVILHVKADNLNALSQKLSTLLEKAGVHMIEYNGDLVSLEKFRL